MAKRLLKEKAVSLRKKGKSYSEILRLVPASKSSLSLWLRNFPLTEAQIARLQKKKERSIERYIASTRAKRIKRLSQYYRNQRKKHIPLTKNELFLAGLFLYWGEGAKTNRCTISVNNTDPRVVKFMLYWMIKSLGIPKERIKVLVHLYSDMDVEKELNYWSETLRMNRNRFSKPYIKESTRAEINQKGFGHGTCALYSGNTVTKENMLMATEAISDYYNKKLSKI